MTDVAGEYEVQVSALEEHAKPGYYELKADLPHRPTDSDLARVNAERTSRDALLLAKEDTTESWKKARDKFAHAQAMWHDLADSYQGRSDTGHVGVTR